MHSARTVKHTATTDRLLACTRGRPTTHAAHDAAATAIVVTWGPQRRPGLNHSRYSRRALLLLLLLCCSHRYRSTMAVHGRIAQWRPRWRRHDRCALVRLLPLVPPPLPPRRPRRSPRPSSCGGGEDAIAMQVAVSERLLLARPCTTRASAARRRWGVVRGARGECSAGEEAGTCGGKGTTHPRLRTRRGARDIAHGPHPCCSCTSC